MDGRGKAVRSRTRWCKQHKGFDRFGPRELRNTLRFVWFVLLMRNALVSLEGRWVGGDPARPYIGRGSRVTWNPRSVRRLKSFPSATRVVSIRSTSTRYDSGS